MQGGRRDGRHLRRLWSQCFGLSQSYSKLDVTTRQVERPPRKNPLETWLAQSYCEDEKCSAMNPLFKMGLPDKIKC
jgi:hypothetical protein